MKTAGISVAGVLRSVGLLGGAPGGLACDYENALLKTDNDYLLLVDGCPLLLSAPALLKEDGDELLFENGDGFLLQ